MSSAEDLNFLQNDSDPRRQPEFDISDLNEYYLPSEILSACRVNAYQFVPNGVFVKLLIERFGADNIRTQQIQIDRSLAFTHWLLGQRETINTGNTRLDPFTNQSKCMATIYRCAVSGDYQKNKGIVLRQPDCISIAYEMIAVALLSHVCDKLTNDKAIMIPSIDNPASKQAAVLNTSFSLLESDINHHGGHKPTLSTKISAHDATVKISPLPFTGAESSADFAFGFSVENARLRKGLVRRPPNPDPRVMHLNLIDPGRQQLEIVCRFIDNMNLGNADSEFFRTGEGLKFMGAFASALERQLKMFELMIEKNNSAYYHHTVYFFQLGLLLLAEIRKLA